MRFAFEIEVSRVEGKFASRDEIGEHIASEIEGMDISGLGADGESTYQIESVTDIS